jgi:adenine-specific DNA-methyltransferase
MIMKTIKSDSQQFTSKNITVENIDKLKDIFPESFIEGKIDFDVLKQLLGATIDDKEEKYGLNWHGKRLARQMSLTPSTGTLRPAPEDSVDWDSTKNIMIEGDNLEVLKLLQKSYSGKVKMIYIDPPYNTGKDFVYPDNFHDNINNYLEITGQKENGKKISSNPESSGRYHTDWLNMMYPRLKLARSLLREDGVIFISIDDSEVDNLKKICNEIFGEENFIANIVWQKKYSPQNDATYFSDMHDNILVYCRLARKTKLDNYGWKVDLFPREKEQNSAYKNLDYDERGRWKAGDLSVKTYSEKNDFPIVTPSGRIVYPPSGTCWRFSKQKLSELIADNRIWFGENGSNVPSVKRFLSEVQEGVVPVTWWTYKECGHNQEAKQELKNLMRGDEIIFDTPKPLRLIERMLQLSSRTDQDALVLDFFAGSGTTGHAVFQKNIIDNGNRKFILVQLPEPIENQQYKNIAELTKERLRRAGTKIKAENPEWQGDIGFKVFKLDTSNIRAWQPDDDNLEQSLFDHQNHIVPDRSQNDILYELMLKRGIDLIAPVEQRNFNGKAVSCVDNGALISCLEPSLSGEDIEYVAKGITDWHQELNYAGETVCFFLDSAFADDNAKSNLVAILEQQGLTQLRSL